MTDALRFPWDGDPEAQRGEVAPSVFRPRRARESASQGRSHASRPSPRPTERRAPAASIANSAGVATAPALSTRRASGHASRAAGRDRIPGRVVQGPRREVHEPDYLVLLAAVALSAVGILMVYQHGRGDGPRRQRFAAVTTQLTWAVVGGIVLLVAMRIDYRHWRAFSVLGLALAMGLLVLVLLAGHPSAHPAHRGQREPRAGCASAGCPPSTRPSSPQAGPRRLPGALAGNRGARRWAASDGAWCPSSPSSARWPSWSSWSRTWARRVSSS